MKNRLVILIILLVTQSTFSQERKKKDLIKDEDVEIALLKSEENRFKDWEVSLKYAKEALDLAHELKNNRLIGDSHKYMGIVYFYTNNFQKAEKSYKNALQAYKTMNYKEGIGNVNHNLALLYKYNDEWVKSLKHYKISLKIDKDNKDEEGVAYTLNNMAVIYKTCGKYDSALLLLQQCLKYFKKVNDEENLIDVYINMASIYSDNYNYEKSFYYLNMALVLSDEYGDLKAKSICLSQLGMLQSEMGNYQFAKNMLDESLNIRANLQDDIGIINVLVNYGLLLGKEKNYRESNHYFLRALKMLEKVQNLELEAHLYHYMANNLLATKHIQKSISYYKLSNRKAKKINAKLIVKNNIEQLVKAHALLQEYEKSHVYLESYFVLNNELKIKE